MLKLLYAPTAAGTKALLALEELKAPYLPLPINVVKKVQSSETYKNIVPTSKIPALIDDGKLFFESGAILYHLAKKYNKLIPQQYENEVLSWFFWEASDLSPTFLQHYKAKLLNLSNQDIYLKIENKIKDLLTLLNTQLENKEYIAKEFSIADISAYSWIKHYVRKQAIPNLLDSFSNIQNWLNTMDNRETTKKVTEISKNFNWEEEITEEQLKTFINS